MTKLVYVITRLHKKDLYIHVIKVSLICFSNMEVRNGDYGGWTFLRNFLFSPFEYFGLKSSLNMGLTFIVWAHLIDDNKRSGRQWKTKTHQMFKLLLHKLSSIDTWKVSVIDIYKPHMIASHNLNYDKHLILLTKCRKNRVKARFFL